MMSFDPIAFRPLMDKAESLVTTAFASEARVDPILGDLSRIHSIAMSLTRGHGLLLEDAVAAALRHTGEFEVAQGVRFPVTEAALRIVDTNGPELLPRIRLAFDAEARFTSDLDVVAIARDGSSAVAVDIKRGVGSMSGSRRAALERDLQAVRLLLRSFARQQGFPVDDVAVGVIDVFGAGVHPARLTVDRSRIDSFFRAPVLQVIDGLTERLNEAVRRRAPELLATASGRAAVQATREMPGVAPEDTPVSTSRRPWTEVFAVRSADRVRRAERGTRRTRPAVGSNEPKRGPRQLN